MHYYRVGGPPNGYYKLVDDPREDPFGSSNSRTAGSLCKQDTGLRGLGFRDTGLGLGFRV